MSGRSIVEYFAEHEKYPCGYCGSKDTNYSHGLWAHTMKVQDYQDLIDRGWRRSGCYTYKPTMNQTCCPQYPIRCKALEFKLSKSQKKIIKRVNKYLNTGVKPSLPSSTTDEKESVEDGSSHTMKEAIPGSHKEGSKGVLASDSSILDGASIGNKEMKELVPTNDLVTVVHSERDKEYVNKKNKRTDQVREQQKKSPRQGEGTDPSKPACKKAKVRRKEAWLMKHSNNPGENHKEKKKCQEKSLEDHLNEIVDNPAHNLEIRLVRACPKSQLFEDSFSEAHKVYKRYQMCIHKDPEDKPSEKQYTRFLCSSPLQIQLLRRNDPKIKNFEESQKESYEVFKKYQMAIHKDSPEDCDKPGYIRFLVDSPLEAEHKDRGFPDGFGSFHQHYLLDGKIIAVGVIDILPHCVSSVYLYYDPEYDFLSLGHYSALREVAFTRYLHTLEPSIEYYYMGFYIHSCPKMRYKGKYFPSFLLCPETYEWISIDNCVPKLDQNRYCRFAEPGKVDANGELDLAKLLVLYQRQPMPYELYVAISGNGEDAEEVREYGLFVGNACAQRILLYRK